MDISTLINITIEKYFDTDNVKEVRKQSTDNLTQLIEQHPHKDDILKGALGIIQENRYLEFNPENHAFFCQLIKSLLKSRIEMIAVSIDI